MSISMRIIVPIKQVPETDAVKMDPETGTMVRDGLKSILNPLDLYAIEQGLVMRDQYGGELIAVSMGPPKAKAALEEAIAMGADRGVLLSDRRFGGADTWSTAYVLSVAIEAICAEGGREIGVEDIILCGERATDGDTGQTGPGIAAFLDLPIASYIGKFESLENNQFRCWRLVEDGHEILDVQLPAVFTVVKEVASPRLPTLRGKQKARAMNIPVWGVDDLAVNPECLGLKGSPTRVVTIFTPKVARECEILLAHDDAGIDHATDRIIHYLNDNDLLTSEQQD
jgi:electron transfer flavoprotein beta subunit